MATPPTSFMVSILKFIHATRENNQDARYPQGKMTWHSPLVSRCYHLQYYMHPTNVGLVNARYSACFRFSSYIRRLNQVEGHHFQLRLIQKMFQNSQSKIQLASLEGKPICWLDTLKRCQKMRRRKNNQNPFGTFLKFFTMTPSSSCIHSIGE